jgi:hypothetical protein
MPTPELPGEFVSEDLRADCARFLDDQRARIRRRSELPSERAFWLPDDSASQSPPNSRSAQSEQ